MRKLTDWLRPGINTSPWPYMKYVRAIGLWNELTNRMELEATASSNHVVSEISDDGLTVVFKLSMKYPIPVEEWALIFGDLIHNCRSALDSLAWELTHMDGATPAAKAAKKIYWPMCRTDKEWSAQLSGPLATIPDRFRNDLRKLQPLSRPDPEMAVVLALHEFDIMDKHKSSVSARTSTHNQGMMSTDLRDENGNKVSFDPASLRFFGGGPCIDGQPLFQISASTPIATATTATNFPLSLIIARENSEPVEMFNFVLAVFHYMNIVFDLIYRGQDAEDSQIP